MGPGPGISKKAKLVYEFETFYNQSAYLCPVMADFFRAMGVQMAAMWHYSMPAYAKYRQGSHVLNLKCTPDKAASFAVAGKIFEETPLLLPYHTESTTEWKSQKFAYSYRNNMSIFSDSTSYFYSADIADTCSLKPIPGVKQIFGYGSSPLLSYTGNGNYQIGISDNELDIIMQPDIRHLKELWNSKDRRKIPATIFIEEDMRTMKLYLEGWGPGSYTLYEILDGRQIKKGSMQTCGMFVKPWITLFPQETSVFPSSKAARESATLASTSSS